LFWSTAHFVCSRHRRFRHLEKSNTDCLLDEVICGWYGAGARDFSSFLKRRDPLWDAPCLLFSVCRWIFPGRTWNWQLTNSFIPPCAFMASLGSNFF
jgi:hypothetical protein